MHQFIGRFSRGLAVAAAVAASASCHSNSHGGGGGGGTPPTPPPHLLYVSTTSNVSIFNLLATGNNVSPVGTIAGTNTGLNGPAGIGLDSSGRLYVANASAGASSIAVYAKGAAGNATPLHTISGTSTGLGGPYMLALDSGAKLYVTNNALVTGGSDSVVVFLPGANGNVTPVQTIAGSLTHLATPTGIGVDSSGNVVVANAGTGSATSSITVYAKGATGNAPPIRTISGPNTKLDQPTGLLVDSGGRYWVCNASTVLVFAAGVNGNVAPAFTLGGSATQMTFTNVTLTFDPTGALDVVNSQSAGGTSTVLEYAGLNASTLPANGNIAPARTVGGSSVGGAFGIAAR